MNEIALKGQGGYSYYEGCLTVFSHSGRSFTGYYAASRTSMGERRDDRHHWGCLSDCYCMSFEPLVKAGVFPETSDLVN